MKLLSVLFVVSLFVGCNRQAPVDKGEQGYRQNQEQETAPNDYTQGTDTRTPPSRNP
jgi:hypothetical protein